MDHATIEQVKAKHPGVELHRFGAAGVELIVRPPTRMEWKRFRAELLDDRKKLDAVEGLARACVVYPDAAGFDAMLERRPALAQVVGDKIGELAGLEESAHLEKL